MAERFYQLKLDNRDAYWEDIGQFVNIAGIVVETTNGAMTLLVPNALIGVGLLHSDIKRMSPEDWSKFIQCSDDPKIFELDPTGGIKAVHRKIRYQISGDVQQKIWALDSFKCVYCDRQMGEVQLSIDHFVPLELGGSNDETNYLSACRRCNKQKGNKKPEDFCAEMGVDFQRLQDLLKTRRL